MVRLKICLYNGVSLLYHLFGAVIHWCFQNNYDLTIYTDSTRDNGWIAWYSKTFDNVNFKPINKFIKDAHLYHLVFVTSEIFPNHWVNYYDLRYKLIYRDPEKLAVFPIDLSRKINEKINIVTDANIDYINQENIMLHIITDANLYSKHPNCRYHCNLDAAKLIRLFNNCDYYLFGSLKYLGLAVSCGVKPIMKQLDYDTLNYVHKYMNSFKNALTYKKNITELLPLIKADKDYSAREQLINSFDRRIREKYPNLGKELDLTEASAIDKELNNINIPKSINLMWLSKTGKNAAPPAKYNDALTLWKRYNPQYTVKIWNNEDVDNLISTHFPEYYEKFNNLPMVINKCDVSRFCLIYIYGGIYADLDFYCMNNLDSLIADKDLIVMRELPEHDENRLFNGIFAAVPKHKFIKGWIDRMFKNFEARENAQFEFSWSSPIPYYNYIVSAVHLTTSPAAFWTYYESLKDKPELYDRCLLMPYANGHKLSSICQNAKHHYTYTLWTEGTLWAHEFFQSFVCGDDSSSMLTGYSLLLLVIIIFLLYLFLKYYKKVRFLSAF